MQVLIRCDASESIGGGHAMRCLALGQELQRGGNDVSFATRTGADMIGDRATSYGLALHTLSEADPSADLEATEDLAQQLGADWVLVDGAALVDNLAAPLSHRWQVLALDDRGFAAPPGSHFHVLNTNVWATPADYSGFAPRDLLLGRDFVLLREEFHDTLPIAGQPTIARLLVLAGASDPTGFALRLLEGLEGKFSSNLAIDVVVGPMNRRRTELENLAARAPQICLHFDPPDMAALMRQADLAISASGGTLWELYALGIPTIAVVIAENQRRNAVWLSEKGFPAVVADDAHQAANSALQLADSASLRQNLATREQQLIDSRGVARVVDFISAATRLGKKKVAV